MITTRDAINYQFSLIFGYSSPNNLIVGDIIGPGKLTKKRVNELSKEVIKFLRMYNAILRDFGGSEVFSIEFSLEHLKDIHEIKNTYGNLEILPKSMILIPGKYKDCESMLLALKPETGQLNIHKSRKSVNSICKLFFEVEEFTNRPELGTLEKELVFKKFVSRFNKKLFGELIEDKWNKKLIGLSTSLPTERKMINTYATIKSNVDIKLHNRPHEIIFSNPKFIKIKTPFEGQTLKEHLKYSISEPSANFIIENTLKLGANLINLANTGTIDESQERIVSYLINHIEEEIKKIGEPREGKWLISYNEKKLNELKKYLDNFLKYSKEFLSTGEMGDLSDLLEKYKKFITEKGRLEKINYEEINNLAINTIVQIIVQKKDLRAIELSSLINYFSELIKNSFIIIKKSLPLYLSRRKLKILTFEFIKNLSEKFEKEQEPSRILGQKFIEKFNAFLLNQIEISSITLPKDHKFEEGDIIKEFKDIINKNVDPFFDNIKLEIGDLVSFAEIEMEKDSNVIKTHIENFKKFSSELTYLLSYILRYSTIKRYIKDEPDKEISDPVTFANRFHRFLEKRIGGINLTWKSYILEWIKDYAKKFLKLEEGKKWTLEEVFNDFIRYFEERKEAEQQTENFLKFLDKYIGQISNIMEKNHLIDFFRQYEFCIDIKTEFPKYMKNKIKTEVGLLNLQIEKKIPIKYINFDEKDTFSNYVKEMELKYFSKLIPLPISLILKHVLTNDEKELFNGDLFHVINFRFWGQNKAKSELADNFKEVYREWLKEL